MRPPYDMVGAGVVVGAGWLPCMGGRALGSDLGGPDTAGLTILGDSVGAGVAVGTG